jgi:prepilin-type N-terminal cleavage/methylation domain-containing protein
MGNQKGFSLIELLIVVAILGIIASIAVPNLVRAKQAADSASAISSCRTLITAETLYLNATSNTSYGTLSGLAPQEILDTNLAAGAKSDYTFTVAVSGGTPPGLSCNADPIDGPTVMNHFYTDQTAVIRFKLGSPAASSDKPIQ